MKILFVLDDQTFGETYAEIAVKYAPFADMIWYRIKDKNDVEIYERAHLLRALLPDKMLVLSQRVDIAAAVRFNGVHLNSRSLAPSEAKRIFPQLIIGYSAHSVPECFTPCVDYFTLSPIFDTPKNYEVKPLGLVKAPAPNVFALGGIEAHMAQDFEKLGYAGIAGIRFVRCLATF